MRPVTINILVVYIINSYCKNPVKYLLIYYRSNLLHLQVKRMRVRIIYLSNQLCLLPSLPDWKSRNNSLLLLLLLALDYSLSLGEMNARTPCQGGFAGSASRRIPSRSDKNILTRPTRCTLDKL